MRHDNDLLPENNRIGLFDGVFDRESLEQKGVSWKIACSLMDGIDRFVHDVIRKRKSNNSCSDDPLLHLKVHKNNRQSAHARRFDDYLEIVDCLSPEYRFSESLELFREAVAMARSETECAGKAAEGCCAAGSIIERVICAVGWLYRHGGYQQRLADERSSASKLFVGGCNYIDQLFAATARMVVVRVDFHYAEPICSGVTIDRATADMARMIANMRNNSIFRGLVGYLLKLECGVLRGFHWHALFFFNAQIRNPLHHPMIGQSLGDYWKTITTKGEGTYWNGNGDAKRYEAHGRSCVGLVTYADVNTIQALKQFVVGYLTKTYQYAQPRSGRRYRTFRRGQAPMVVKRRPRSVDVSITSEQHMLL